MDEGDSVRRRLETYRARRVRGTPKPAGRDVSGVGGGVFVVQRHRARRLHYDLRLEVDGALASWAVPKGPTLDPKARQLAVQVEDHPLEYVVFEGVIPHGEYGGGDVIVWDTGSWQPADTDDPAQAIERGELHFNLNGSKLGGRFVLVRREGEDWLLIHKRDDAACPGWDPEEHPHSVLSGRTNDEVAAAPAALWQSGVPAAVAAVGLGRTVSAGWRVTNEELAALDDLGRAGRWSVQGRELKLTNLDKPLFPGRDGGSAVTKGELVRYYAVIAPYMLPYLTGRPVNMHRYPDGAGRPGFWQKEIPRHAPDWLPRWHNVEADAGETDCYVVPDGVAALVWLANFGALELHPWTSALPDVHRPTWALIDVDPGTRTGFADVLVLARLYRTALDHLELAAVPKVTGQRGVQIWVPVRSGYTFAETRGWVEKLSRAVGRSGGRCRMMSWEWQKNRRRGLARLDFTQNAINKTLVAPFSARPSAGAPISVPITWDELDDPDLSPDGWTLRNVVDRVQAVGDPLAPLVGKQQELPPL